MADDATTYDPTDYSVDEVNDYLNTLSGTDDPEYQRVLQAERDGKARKGILGDDEPEADTDGRMSTRGASFQEAAEAAEPDPKGYLGESPEAIRTGRRDKGLSQKNPAVMNQGGAVPDPSPAVDDSEAIKALDKIKD